MPVPNPALAEPMLQHAVPRSARCSRKVLTLLIGLGFAVLLGSMLWTHHGGEPTPNYKPTINMASQYMKPVRAQQFMQPAKAFQPTQRLRAQAFALPTMQPVRIPQFHQPQQLATPFHLAQPMSPRQSIQPVKAGEGYGDWGDEGGGGGTGTQTGVVMRWNFDRGFGFIKPETGGEDVFCHVRNLVDGEGSVQEGNKVTYNVQYDDRQGKSEASDVQLAPGGDGDFRAEVGGGGFQGGAPDGEAGTGVLLRWMDEKGFGFIQPEGGGDDLFCHVSGLADGEGSVVEGNKVTYVAVMNDRQGKLEAAEVRLAPGGEGEHRVPGSFGPGGGAMEEKREAPDGSGAYVKQEFIEFYGGTTEWDAAPPQVIPQSGEAGTGVLMRWMLDRGFGFIKPESGGEDLFVHVNNLVDGEGSVGEGNKVTYVTDYNARKGKFEAAQVKLAAGGEGDFRADLLAPPADMPAPEGGTGVLMRFMQDRGFGFIKPESGGEDIFTHVRSWPDENAVQEGNKVTYSTVWNDRKQSYEASDVRLAPGGDGDFRAELSGPPPGTPALEAGTGVLLRWMDDRGFGFIEPEGGGEDLFCHISSLLDGEGSVQEGNKVTYVPKWNDRQNKYEASEVRLAPGGEGEHRAALVGAGIGGEGEGDWGGDPNSGLNETAPVAA